MLNIITVQVFTCLNNFYKWFHIFFKNNLIRPLLVDSLLFVECIGFQEFFITLHIFSIQRRLYKHRLTNVIISIYLEKQLK